MYRPHRRVGSTTDVFGAPRHPYTRSLLAAAPRIGGPRVTENFTLQGEPPDPSNVPSGCRFRTRLPARHRRLCDDRSAGRARVAGMALLPALARAGGVTPVPDSKHADREPHGASHW